MQSYTEIDPNRTLGESLVPLLDNDKTIMSNHAGTAFPTTNLQVGMFCLRTDTMKLYQLKDASGATPVWQFVLDLAMIAPWGQFANLGNADDLNNVNVSGWYHQNSDANAAGGAHYPVAVAGMLRVFGTAGGAVYQFYTVYSSGESYQRTKAGNVWGDWRKVFDSVNLTNLNQLTNGPGFQTKNSPELQSWRETVVSAAISAANINYALDCAAGNVYDLTLGANPTFSISNPPPAGKSFTLTLKLTQDATGSRTVSWPASVKWPNDVAPVLTTTANKTDFVALETLDGGAKWFGFPGNKNYA